jgi:hypothetical protein
MCWNWQVSLGSFGLITAIAYALYMRNGPNDRFLAVFLFSYGSMQFFETFMWLGQTKEYEQLNRIGSIAGSLLLYSHPLAFSYGMSIDSAYKASNFTYPIAIATVFFLYGVYRLLSTDQSLLAKPDTISKHLVWDSPHDYLIGLIFMLGLGVIFALNKYPALFTALVIYFLAPILILFAMADAENIDSKKIYYGSYWCWLVATGSFLFYVRPF